MFLFRGFRASLNFNSAKTSELDHFDHSPGISLNGAYRTNRDELFGSDLYPQPTKRIITPSMVQLPNKHSGPPKTQSKSTGDLTKHSNEAISLQKSTPAISRPSHSQSTNANGNEQKKLEQRLAEPGKLAEKERQRPAVPTVSLATKNQATKDSIKEQKKLEKQRIAEQKKQEKLAEKERQRAEKLRKEREKQEQQTRATQQKIAQTKSKKRAAPQPVPKTVTPANPLTQRPQSSTNTLESSISKSSGPPPYSAVPEVTPSRSDDTGNTSLAKPADDSSWDMISQHRQQMIRHPGVSKSDPKQKHLDLHYNPGTSRVKDNSDA